MPDLKQFETELTAEHAALTKAYDEAHVAAEAAWGAYEAAKTALTAFRSQYGHVLKALHKGAVKVEG